MKQYEYFRENGWKSYFNDPFFEGDAPTAKVISYFTKGDRYKDAVPIKEVEYDLIVEATWFKERLNHTIKYKRKWNDYDIYQLSALQEYLNQIECGNYKKALLSRGEFASIAGKK